MQQELLVMNNITKIYTDGVVANRNVNFSLYEGEIHAVVGENGAGKSTLMKMLFGIEQPSEGFICLNGDKVVLHTPDEAIKKGIGMVHQHFMLVPSFTVAENIILGIEPHKGLSIDYKKAVQMTEELSKKYNLSVNAEMRVEDLTVAMKQKVEILKALIRGAKILILDEPTAVLTPQETDELFVQLKKLKEEGHTIVFISHKLKEVKAISDRITIMRSGKTEGVFYTKDVTEQQISKLMVGRDIVLKYDKGDSQYGDAVLKVKNLAYKNYQDKYIFKNINFSVRQGQILGIAGVEGNGQTQLIKAITGSMSVSDGAVEINGTQINKKSIKDIRNTGLSYVPEDRITEGMAGDASIADNVISNIYDKTEISSKGIFLENKKITSLASRLVEEFKVKCSGIGQKIGMLSGGNMQKVIVARECSTSPKLLIAEQPTRGVDIGAAHFIHEKLLEMRKNKTAILLVSADLNEVMELSDSLIVMYEGEIVAYFENPSKITEEELGLCMLGLKKHSESELRRAMYE
ncbi:ABC transporter ATP-binding protein [Clostridium oryzae]|uniref:Galactose/methyl galactoside import ATP-binding protein MglA n=1 Tax=Clostridium oryzae TaxID=1450648 RepID=A0A1V4IJY5_9CLOT|nr:ABC transporter ATP-binding protein [Clostridium oryzae]OPJ60213.1 galactose/methyl galactoside import ATP-binding protein MglA [Clostridium oryzae]